MDVVPTGDPTGWKYDPFSGRISAEEVFGRGAADMKGGLAVQMHAMAMLADRTDCAMMLSAVSDEETGGVHGSMHVAEKYRPDIVLIGEPTEGMVDLGEKGVLEVCITSRGKSAHASRPSLGINAIMQMYGKLDALSKISRKSQRPPAGLEKLFKDSESVLGDDVSRITFNPGKIYGGVKTNVVPDLCKAEVDLRLPVGIDTEKAFGIVKRLVGADCAEKLTVAEPNYTEPGNAYVSEFISSVGKRARNPKQVISLGASDGRYFREKGIPTIAYGPGRMEVIHTSNERVGIRDLAEAYSVYCDFLSGFGSK